MRNTFPIRLAHSWAVLTGRVTLPHSPEYMELMKDMSTLDDALAAVKASATRAVAKGQADSAAASAAADVAAALETATVANLADTNAILSGYAPAPAPETGAPTA